MGRSSEMMRCTCLGPRVSSSMMISTSPIMANLIYMKNPGYKAEDVIVMLDYFKIDHAHPSWPVNLWISAMLVLFRPQIETLIRQRDQVIAGWECRYPGVDVYEDRELELTSYTSINVEQQIKRVVAAIEKRGMAA